MTDNNAPPRLNSHLLSAACHVLSPLAYAALRASTRLTEAAWLASATARSSGVAYVLECVMAQESKADRPDAAAPVARARRMAAERMMKGVRRKPQ